MRLRPVQFVLGLAVLLGLAWGMPPLAAQRPLQQERAQRQRQQQQQKQKQKEHQAAKGEQRAGAEGPERGLAGLPPKWVEHVHELSPEEQERFFKNNAHFQSLPPGQQAQIREKLQQFNSLSPAERNDIRIRERNWEMMSPEQREHIRTDILPRWEQLPAERRQLIMGRLGVLRDMSEADRQSKLNDEQFLNGLNPDERDMLRNLNTLRNPPAQ
jgi:Protein of unknown function (DUF3106)